MTELMEQQLKEFKTFIQKFAKADEKMDQIYERKEEPTQEEEKEFAKLQEEFCDFMHFFKKFDAEYWDGFYLTDVAEKILNEYGGF